MRPISSERQLTLQSHRGPALFVKAGRRVCAIPLEHVAETMRPLVIEPLSGTPEFIRGVSVVRGMPIPVVDLQVLLEDVKTRASYGRFVTLKVGDHHIALAVEEVVGVRTLDWTQLRELPPLLQAVGDNLVEAIGACDTQLLIVLRATRIVPDEFWASLPTRTEAT